MLDVTSSHAQASHGEPSHTRKDTYGPVKTSLRLLGVDERLRPHLPTASHQTAERGAMAGHPIALGGRLFVGGRALVKAGRRPPPSGGFGLDMGPTTDSARRQAVNRQERADSQPPAAREKPLDRHPCHMRENTGAAIFSIHPGRVDSAMMMPGAARPLWQRLESRIVDLGWASGWRYRN